jgi:hypothetical protein
MKPIRASQPSTRTGPLSAGCTIGAVEPVVPTAGAPTITRVTPITNPVTGGGASAGTWGVFVRTSRAVSAPGGCRPSLPVSLCSQ